MNTTGALFSGLIGCFVFSAMADGPTISNVEVRQLWPWSRLVNIDYTLNSEAGKSMDVRLSAFDGTNVLSLPECSLSGGLNGVSNGVQRIVWNPLKSAYTNQALMRFNVDLTVTNTPLYLIVDLTKTNTTDQIVYVYEADLTSGAYGTVETNPIPGVTSLVWTGVTNDTAFKTDLLVMRRVPAGAYMMGSTIPVTLTKPFYVGVFEVTQRQWERVMGNRPSGYSNPDFYMMRPVEQISDNDIRGATNDTPAVNWPVTDRTVVTTNSFIGKLRSQTGIETFDMPTTAQWEYACRAGTTTAFNDGNTSATVSGANGYTNEWLNVLGRYAFNGGYIIVDGTKTPPPSNCAPTNGTALVGSYKPNAWGLYDMHGNVYEKCLDWAGTNNGGVDPTGPTSGLLNKRMMRGGTAFENASNCIPAGSNSTEPTGKNGRQGFRLVWTLP